MMQVAVVGGTGTLGAFVVEELVRRGYEARVLSRHAPHGSTGSTHRHVDLANGEGLPDALAEVDVVVDASNGSGLARHARSVLVEGTERLLRAEAEVGVKHHVLISVVGIEAVPLPYYSAKIEQERAACRSSIPTSVLRSTQFHQLLDHVFGVTARFGVLPRGRTPLQPIDAREVASTLLGAVEHGPWTAPHEIAGPEILQLTELARIWMAATGRRRPLVPVPALSRVRRALHDGGLTAPEAQRATLTFTQWLKGQRPERDGTAC